jgi:hypothetical protein
MTIYIFFNLEIIHTQLTTKQKIIIKKSSCLSIESPQGFVLLILQCSLKVLSTDL